jgi:hypothetical protein
MIRRLPFTPTSCYHDHGYYSVFYGEPFLFGDFLYYFDGWDLRVVGYDRDGTCIPREAFHALAREAAERWRIRSITLEAPETVPLPKSLGFGTRILVDRPDRRHDHEFMLDLPRSKTRAQRKAVRRAKRLGTESAVTRHRSLSHEHYRLIDRFIRDWDSNAFYKSEYIASIFCCLARPRAVLVDARSGGKLVGFTIAYPVRSLGVFRVLVTDLDVSGVSDSLHETTLEALSESGVDRVSLGFSLNAGLRRFKRKWGGRESWRGAYEIFWSRSSRFSSYLWATRAVRAG